MMKRRRTDLKQAECQSIAQVVSLKDSDQSQIKNAEGENSLALSPAKFPMRMCIIRRAVTQQEKRRKRVKGKDICELLQGIVMEILMRLPTKSLMRFKCVSKEWSSLISCRYFCNRLFTTVTRRQPPRLYMCLVDKADGRRVLLSISSPDNSSFVVVDQDLSIPGMGGYFLNVVRGLMCFSLGQNKACIYNPSTKQLLTLPALKSDIKAERGQKKRHTQYFIGHDPVSDQYKLVCTVGVSSRLPRLGNLKSEHWVFALEAGGSWKKVVPVPENYLHHAPFTLGRSTSGSVVRYIAWPDNYNCVVVSFDIRSEQFTIIPVPREIFAGQVVPAVTMRADLIEYGGKIAIFHHTHLKDEGSADVWVFEDVGKNKNEWSKKTLFLQTCQRHLVQDIVLMVRGTTQDGKVILAPLEMHSRFYILYYDLECNDLTKVEIKGVPLPWLHKKCYFDLNYMGDCESFIYSET